jgi:predicted Zn-dependent peptidase
MLQQPLLDEEELQREKGVIVEELNMYRDMPMDEIENILEGMMWPREALGQNIVGTKETVTKFTPAMFRDYKDRHYQMPNMILGISGRFDQKKLDRLIKEYWVPLKRRRYHRWDEAKDGQKQPRVIVQYKDTEQAHMSFGFKGLAFKDKRNPAALVLGTILGGGMSSRLFTEIRERRGLAYYVRASSSNYQDTGVFNIGSGVQVDKIHDAITVIMSELQRICRVPVDPKELLKAKEYLKGRTTLALEDNQARLDWCIEQQAFLGRIQSPQDLFKKVDRVSALDVQAVAKEFFKLSRLNLAIIGPYKSDTQFKKLLKF